MWAGSKSRGGHRPIPQGWKLVSYRILHSEVGGVTDGSFNVSLATPLNGVVKSKPPDVLFPNYLHQVWDPTVGGRVCKESSDSVLETANTVRGILSWKTRGEVNVKGPTVFNPGRWASRRLTRRELSDAVDMPAVIFKAATEDVQEELAHSIVPGKILAQSIALLIWSRDQKPEEMDTPPQPMSQVSDLKRKRSTRDEHVSLKVRKVSWTDIEKKKNAPDESPPLSSSVEPNEEPSFLELETSMTTVSAKAVKSDKAAVPRHLWDRRVVEGSVLQEKIRTKTPVTPEEGRKALDGVRSGALRWWKKNVAKSFHRWYETTDHDPAERDEIYAAGLQAIQYAESCSWWEWNGGSGIFFWRWPKHYQKEMREGVPPYFIGPPPATMDRQPKYGNEETRLLVLEKVSNVIDKGYVKVTDLPHLIKAMMYMFHVPKGLDIRMVYDGSKSGLNSVLYAPWFHIHTVKMMCRNLLPGYWCADNDYGEQFLNFNLHQRLQQYCGVDLSQLLGERNSKGEVTDVMGKWTRCAMGLRPSPYNAVKGALIARRMILGDRWDPENPFQWSKVRLNQPGDDDYRSDLPWLMLLREDGELMTALLQYIDDLRTCAKDEKTAWEASNRIAKILTFLGLQDAARKKREPSQEPGAWSGATVSTDPHNVFQSVTQDRWEKTQRLIRELGVTVDLWDDVSEKFSEAICAARKAGTITTEEGVFHHKTLESTRGFLVYVANTFTAMIPFLKGIHLTVDHWRPYRNEDGWKMSYRDRRLAFEVQDETPPPKTVQAAARLKSDLEVLMNFTSSSTPPKVAVRPKHSLTIFIVGDASGSGFGGSSWNAEDDEIVATYGAWKAEVSEESSNFREAYNLVLLLEDRFKSGEYKKGTEVFIFTDNSTAERAFNKGSSSNPELHELVIRIRRMEMTGVIFPRFVWISGERMIAQGTDGLSRGDLTGGVMSDGLFLKHVPLNKTVKWYQTTLIDEINSWLPSGHTNWIWLTEEDWFDKVFKDPNGSFVWTPSAALARVATEQLCEVKHIHPNTNHMFLAPALMTSEFRKLLSKQSDALLTLPVGPACWPKPCYEPLVLSLTCPMLPHSPWSVKRTKWIGSWKKEMLEVWKGTPRQRRDLLTAQDLDASLVDDDRMEEEDDLLRFKEGRNGDHLLCTFQCDHCQFLNMQRRIPIPDRPKDDLLLVCIRRANLDAFWSRERSTVAQNRREGTRLVRILDTLGFGPEGGYPSRGPFPIQDSTAVQLACCMLVRSLDAGKNARTIQFDTLRKLRSHMSNYSHTCPGGVGGTFVGEDSNASTLSNAQTNTPWFRRFVRGCHRRMGDVWLPDRPLTITELKACLHILEEDWANLAGDPTAQATVGITACVIISGFFAALRGEEIVRVDLGSMFQHWDESASYPGAPHVPLMLSGRFKREIGEKLFTQPLAPESKSGVKIMSWYHRTMNLLAQNGVTTGPLFRNSKGKRASVSELDVLFHGILERVQKRWPNIIPDSVNAKEEYSCLRSLRRGATAEAQNADIPEEVIVANNRWRKHCRSKGSLPSMSMMERYSDAKASVKALTRFSGGL